MNSFTDAQLQVWWDNLDNLSRESILKIYREAPTVIHNIDTRLVSILNPSFHAWRNLTWELQMHICSMLPKAKYRVNLAVTSRDNLKLLASRQHKHQAFQECNYIIDTCPSEGRYVWSIFWSPSGDRIATKVLHEQVVKFWDVYTGELLFTLTHPSDIASIDWEVSGDKTRIVTNMESYECIVWDCNSGDMLTPFRVNNLYYRVASKWCTTRAHILSVTHVGEAITVWDADTGTLIYERFVNGVHMPIQFVAWNADGSKIVASAVYEKSFIIDGLTGQVLHVIHLDSNNILRSAWSPSGNHLLLCTEMGNAKVWNGLTGSETLELYYTRIPPQNDVMGNMFFGAAHFSKDLGRWSPCGKYILTVVRCCRGSTYSEAYVVMWDAQTGRQMYECKCDALDAAFSADGTRVAICCGGGLLHLEHEDGIFKPTGLPSCGYDTHCVAWSPDQKMLAVGADMGRVKLYHL